MASLFGNSIRSAVRCSSRSIPLFRAGARLPIRRAASQLSGQGGSLNWGIIAAGAGIATVTVYTMFRSKRNQSSRIGIESAKVSDYAKSGASHPEAEAEQLIAPEATPDKDTSEATSSRKPSEGAETAPTTLTLPSHVPYVLIGAGTASFAAAKAIREADPQAKVLIIGDEDYTPYSRPPLSKQLWFYEDHEAASKLKFKASWSKGKIVDPFYSWNFCDPTELSSKEEGGVAVLKDKKAVKLDPAAKKICLSDGFELTYDKCLLATGGQPRNLPIFKNGPDELKSRVSLYRKIPDYLALDKLASSVETILIVGGGFLGSELAAGLAHRGKERGLKVIQIFPEEGNLGLVLPKELSKWTTDKVRKEGIEVHPGNTLETAVIDDGKVKVKLSGGEELQADHVVVAVGLEPNTQLAKSSRLETDSQYGGYRVNAELQACSDVWVAGDVSCFFDPYLGRRRVEHHDHANVSGRLAGENMTGAHKRFSHQSMFWSDIGQEVGFEAVGIIDSKLPTTGVWARKSDETAEVPLDDYSKGVVFYHNNDGRIVGVLTWNLFGKMDAARKVIAEEKYESDIGTIVGEFDIHQKSSE